MGWTNDQTNEITAPADTPFLPGNNVVGVGTQLPPELVAAGYDNAIVFYDTDWNPSSTSFSIKFRFIASNGTGEGLVFGYGYCTDPNASQTATVVAGLQLQLTSGAQDAFFYAPDSSTFVDFLTNTGGTAHVEVSNTSTGYTAQLYVDTSEAGLQLGPLGIVYGTTNPNRLVLSVGTGGNRQHIVNDVGWGYLPLVNGWVSDSAHPAQYRLMADGTVMLRGHITNPADSINGQQVWSALPAAYQPIGEQEWLCSTGTRTYNGFQKIAAQTDGSAILWDPDTTKTGDVMLSSIRWAVI